MTSRASSISSSSLLDMIPDGPEFDPIRNALKRIQSTFPDELGEITSARLQGFIDEVLSGDGRSADEIRDDIFEFVVGADTIMSVLGVDADTAAQLIAGGNDGGINFSDLNLSGSGEVIPDPTGPPTGILDGGTLVQIGTGDTATYAMMYVVGGIEHLYTFDSIDSVVATLGRGPGHGTPVLSEDTINDGDTWILGSAEGLATQDDGSYDIYFDRIMGEAALEGGARDPGKLGELMSDPAVQRIMAEGAVADWSDERLWAEIRNPSNNTAYYDVFPGIDKIIAAGSPNPENAWYNYSADAAVGLQQLGYAADPDGSYDSYIGEMLDSGITINEFSSFIPTYLRARGSEEFAAALAPHLGREAGFEDIFDILSGTTTPELDDAVERGIIQFQANMAQTNLSVEQISRLAELTDLTEQQIAIAFSQAEEALLSVGTTDLARFGLTREALVNAAFNVNTLGADPLSTSGEPLSATDVQARARKAAQELSIQDDSKAGFFLGFDRLSRPQRQGLAAAAPEVG